MAADVVLGAVCVQRDFWPAEHAQKIIPVLKKPDEQAIGRDEAGFSREDAFEPGLELSRTFFAGLRRFRTGTKLMSEN